jgi:biopolymer transport protein ExbD
MAEFCCYGCGLTRSSMVFTVLVTAFATACGMTEIPVPIALTVHISRTGDCTVTKVTMPCDGVGAYVKGLNAQPVCDIHLEVDRESQYQFVASALGSLKKAGFERVGFAKQD